MLIKQDIIDDEQDFAKLLGHELGGYFTRHPR